MAIANYNSFRVLFDKIASVYFILKNILIFQHWEEMASAWNRHCASCIGALSFPIKKGLVMRRREVACGHADPEESEVVVVQYDGL